MGKISIKHSDESTSDEVIYELMKIEKDVYAPEYCGEYDLICRRFHKYRDMFILAYDEDKIIGYLCFFPISKKLYNEILYTRKFHDDDIEPGDVMAMSANNNIYFLSIALYKKYHGKGIGKAMMDTFFSDMKKEKNNGHNIDDIVASVVTNQGENIMKKYGFSIENDYAESAHYKLYRKGGNEI